LNVTAISYILFKKILDKQRLLVDNGVARIPCALGKKIFLHPHYQKLQSLKLKIGAKARKKQKQNIYVICYFCAYFPNKISSLEVGLDKAITVDGSNNAGVWGLQPPELNGDSGTEPDAAAILHLFSKKYAF